MLAAARVLRWTAVGLWDESLLLLKANVVWFLATLPFALPVLLLSALLLLLLGGAEEQGVGLGFPLMLTSFLALLIPNPASLGIYRLAAVLRRKDTPPFREFWRAALDNIRLGLVLYGIGVLGVVVLAVNLVFYLFQPLPLKGLIVLWAGLLFVWLALQLYLGPLVMLLGERRLLALYRRAALLVLGHPFFVLTFLLSVALLVLLNLFVPPLVPAIGMAYVALLGTGALAELKQRYDPEPPSELDEEPA